MAGKENHMKKREAFELLERCYWGGMTIGEAIAFINRCYCVRPTDEQVRAARNIIKSCTGIDWE